MSHDQLHLFIAGERIGAGHRDTMPVINPATAEEIGRLPVASRDDLDRALDSSAAAFPQWRRTSPAARACILRDAASLLRDRAQRIAELITAEEGIPLQYAVGEVLWSADILDWCAEEGRRAYGRTIPSNTEGLTQTALRVAIGPAVAFTPWNAPVLMPARKIGEALAAGCTSIIKPAEETPAAALEVVRALDDAGLPKGVLNTVFGVPSEISPHLIASPVTRKVSFTGSVEVGRQLAGMAGAQCKPITLELGGHAPVIIFKDADIEKAVEMTVSMKAWNAGQLCGSPTRILVQDDVYDRFLTLYTEATRTLVVGHGMEPASQVGPLANQRRVASMEQFVDDAHARGGVVNTGGYRPAGLGPGFYFQPTVLTGLDTDSMIMNREPFGPVSVVAPFTSVDQALAEANRLEYGLATYAFTRSQKTAAALSEGIETGQLGINTFAIVSPEVPFGGVRHSGYGKEGGLEGVSAYLATRFIASMPE